MSFRVLRVTYIVEWFLKIHIPIYILNIASKCVGSAVNLQLQLHILLV